MKGVYRLKSSLDLYGEGPIEWMFKPYYLAISHKEEAAKKVLGKEIVKDCLDQDINVINKQCNARDFNAGLRGEMDSVVKHLGIKNPNKMWEDMERCMHDILMRYTEKEKDG